MNVGSQIFYINSEDRVSGTSSNFTMELQVNDSSQFDRVAVLQLSIPLSYYIVRNPFDTFTLTEGATTVSITIPNGNYNSNTFKTKVIELLNANSPGGFVYNMEMDLTLAKYTYTVTNNSGVQPIIGINLHLGYQMGFEFHSQNQFVGNTLMSTCIVNFVSTNTVFVHSSCVDDNTSILQEVYSSNTIPYSFITFLNPNVNQYSKKLKSNSDTFYNFTITDDHGNELDLGNQNVFITLQMYKSDDLADLFKKYLKLQLMKASG
jgi:hypothetical protein